MYKRKRSSAASALAGYRPYGKTYTKKRKMFIPGKDRVGGYYGRFAGVKAEHKFFDIDVSDSIVASGGTVQGSGTINGISQGTGETQRIGRKCTIKSINWRYTCVLKSQDAGAIPPKGDSIRAIMFLDKQANGTAATVTGILESNEFLSFNNLSNSSRFVILHDKTITLNHQNLASDGAAVVSSTNERSQHSFYSRCDIPIEFSSVAGVMSEIRSNNLAILLVGQTGEMDFESKVRLRFTDA